MSLEETPPSYFHFGRDGLCKKLIKANLVSVLFYNEHVVFRTNILCVLRNVGHFLWDHIFGTTLVQFM